MWFGTIQLTNYLNRWNCMRILHEIHYKMGEEKKKKKTKQKVKMPFLHTFSFHLRLIKHKAQGILIDERFLISFWNIVCVVDCKTGFHFEFIHNFNTILSLIRELSLAWFDIRYITNGFSPIQQFAPLINPHFVQ